MTPHRTTYARVIGQKEGASPSDRAVAASPSSPAVSPVPASIPDALRPIRVWAFIATPEMIAQAIDLLANVPLQFKACALRPAFPNPPKEPWWNQEVTNRLLQRWRKMGLAKFAKGHWSLTDGAWHTLQAQAIEARRAETGTGSVHESAVRQDAPDA